MIWPFFSHITDREKKYTEWQTPFPLIEFAKGEGKIDSTRVAVFQPVAQCNIWRATGICGRFINSIACIPIRWTGRACGFCFSCIRTRSRRTPRRARRSGGGISGRSITQRQDYNGNTLFPDVRAAGADSADEQDRGPGLFAGMVGVAVGAQSARPARASQSLLWNLYRRQTTPESKKCSLLFGLFQYQSGTEWQTCAIVLYSGDDNQTGRRESRSEIENYV